MSRGRFSIHRRLRESAVYTTGPRAFTPTNQKTAVKQQQRRALK
jgi:hypothetical protein